MVEAYVMIQTAAGRSPALLPEIRNLAGVGRANIVAGEYDIIATIEADSPQALLRLVTDEVQSLDGVGRTKTCLVLE